MTRRWIAVLTSIALLTQVTSMAWAAHAAPAEPAQAAATMPCHGDAAEKAGTPASHCNCCDVGCAFACGGAPLPFVAQVDSIAPEHVVTAAATQAPLAPHSRSPFRPPAR